jgi:hypothetical protein
MKLTARHKYEYRDLDRGEALLIRVGHALWRDRRKLSDTAADREGINAALESVWRTKREYRLELAKKRALRFSKFREVLAIRKTSGQCSETVALTSQTTNGDSDEQATAHARRCFGTENNRVSVCCATFRVRFVRLPPRPPLC